MWIHSKWHDIINLQSKNIFMHLYNHIRNKLQPKNLNPTKEWQGS